MELIWGSDLDAHWTPLCRGIPGMSKDPRPDLEHSCGIIKHLTREFLGFYGGTRGGVRVKSGLLALEFCLAEESDI